MRSTSWHHRNVVEVLEIRHAWLRKFDLHLIRHAGGRISPIYRRHKTAGGSRIRKRKPCLLHRDTELACQFAIDVDIETRVVKRFFKLQIPQCVYSRKFCSNLLGIGAIRSEIGAGDSDLDWRRSAEIHDLAHNVPRLKRKLRARELLR